MDQMQSSCLYMMQMVTAQKTDACQSKSESSEKDDFRKMLEQCGEQVNEPVSQPKTGQTAEAELKPEQEPVKQNVPQMSENLMVCPETDDEEILQMQELAALQILYADQRIVTEAPVETVQAVVVQTVDAAETAGQISGDGMTAQTGKTDVGQLEQTVRTEAEAVQKPVEMAENHADAHGAEADLSEQSIKAEIHEYAETDTAEEFEVTDAETPVFESVETAPIKVSETAAPAETAPTESVEDQIADKLTETLNLGETRVELQLTPENLGKVTIELTQKEDGSLHIALQAESSQTRSLLERDLSGLQSLLSRTTQQEVQINVSQPQEQQQQQNYDGHHQQHQQQEQQENRRSGEDFLNQLRLGLLTPEAEAS